LDGKKFTGVLKSVKHAKRIVVSAIDVFFGVASGFASLQRDDLVFGFSVVVDAKGQMIR
jgi:hypothetical protein